jgi:hypothetical protein
MKRHEWADNINSKWGSAVAAIVAAPPKPRKPFLKVVA